MRTIITLALLIAAASAHAQAAPSWLEDGLYGGGKLNVVIAVVTLILLGIALWLWRQDRRLDRLERDLKERRS